MNTQVTPSSGQPGNGGAPAPVAANGSPVVSDASWLTGLQDADNRAVVTAKGWDKSNSPDVVITSYRDLEQRLGKSVVLPTADSPKEDYTKLYTALGKPAKPDGYAFKLPSAVPADFPYDDAFATEYKVWAHDADLIPSQAQTIHDKFVERAARQLTEAQAAMAAKVNNAHVQIVSKWGHPDSVGYKRNVDMAGRALRKLGLGDTFKAAGLLTARGEIADAKLADALVTIGEGLYAEGDGGGGDPGSMTANNPWADGKENITEQGRILRENPDLANTLVRAAGKDPEKVLFKRR